MPFELLASTTVSSRSPPRGLSPGCAIPILPCFTFHTIRMLKKPALISRRNTMMLFRWVLMILCAVIIVAKVEEKQKTTIRAMDSIPKPEPTSTISQDTKQANEHLIHAAMKGLLGEVKKALNRGAEINHLDATMGNSALMFASKNGHTPIVDYLLNSKADHTLLNRNRHQSALIWAVFGGHLETTKRLLKAGADINQENIRGDTPLIVASYLGHASFIPFLYNNGANIHHTTHNHSFSALHFAAFKGHLTTVQQLLETDIDIYGGDSSGKTPLMLAAMEGYAEIVTLLLQEDIERFPNNDDPLIDRMDLQGETALTLATLFHHEAVVMTLIKAGCNRDHIIPTHLSHSMRQPSLHAGDTALLIALKEKDMTLARTLLMLEVDSTIRDRHGQSPAEIAMALGDHEMYALILSMEHREL